jgi:ubiquinone/menaquinone biosynthesis C-methylase UbiE
MPLARVHSPERLDEPDLDPRELAASLHHVAEVNRWLGGTRALIRELVPLLPARPIRILDVGTGSADVPIALLRRARARGHTLRITAVEPHPQTLRIARRATAGWPVVLVRADARALPFADDAFDVALLSLTLHHLDDRDGVAALRELARVSRDFVIVSELERHRANLLGARLLAATWWRNNPITRHDGPLSVLRAFTPDELRTVARAAGLERVRVARHFFFRLVMVAEPGVGVR